MESIDYETTALIARIPDQENGCTNEVKKQLWLAGPLVLVSLLQFCLQLISLMFVGHLGELALSGASMATSFSSVTGFTLLVSYLFQYRPFVICSGEALKIF